MPQKTKGAAVALQGIAAEIADIRAALDTIKARAVFNPDLVKDKASEAHKRLDGIEKYVADLEPLLERQSPRYEQRLKAVEEQLAQLTGIKPASMRIRRVK